LKHAALNLRRVGAFLNLCLDFIWPGRAAEKGELRHQQALVLSIAKIWVALGKDPWIGYAALGTQKDI
jgi:hypothetical protein